MIVELKLFALAKQLAGREVVELSLAEDASVADLRAALIDQLPALAELTPHLTFAVNAEYAADDTRIPADAEVACIPPVSGG